MRIDIVYIVYAHARPFKRLRQQIWLTNSNLQSNAHPRRPSMSSGRFL